VRVYYHKKAAGDRVARSAWLRMSRRTKAACSLCRRLAGLLLGVWVSTGCLQADVCTQARAAVRTYESDQPLVTTTAKGERAYLEAPERARRLDEQKRLVREYCPAG